MSINISVEGSPPADGEYALTNVSAKVTVQGTIPIITMFGEMVISETETRALKIDITPALVGVAEPVEPTEVVTPPDEQGH